MPTSGQIMDARSEHRLRGVPDSRRELLWAIGAIILAGVVAYANTLSAPFVFDDLASILDNPSLASPIDALLKTPNGYGISVSGRPILNLSLAINHAISGTAVWSFHVMNLLIHVLAGLTLFGVVRRTLIGTVGAQACCAPFHGRSKPAPPQVSATLFALAVALLWMLHPLQTEAVTYIIQRSESLMGLFFLLTLYCFIRGADAAVSRQVEPAVPAGSSLPGAGSRFHPNLWYALSVLSCLLGVGTKEVMVLAPVLVLLYDRTFVSGSFPAAWRRHRWLHIGLMATWVPLAGLVAIAGGNRGGTSGFDVGVAPWAYWLTQFKAIAYYLKLTFWPHPLVFEYGTIWLRPSEALPYALIVVPLVTATAVALWRWPVVGFLGAWFFAILAPTSVVPGTIQMIVEHRMYLPLAAIIVLLTGIIAGRFGRHGLVALLALALAAGLITERRNAMYQNDLDLWQDTVEKTPKSAMAQASLGTACFVRGRVEDAMKHYQVSLELNPKLPVIRFNLGLVLAQTGRLAEALPQFAEALRLNPRLYTAHYELGASLLGLGRNEEALEHYRKALETVPEMAEAWFGCGLALFRSGRVEDAVANYERAVKLRPDYAEAEFNLGVALFQLNRAPDAIRHLERTLVLDPKMAEAHYNLGLVLAQSGHTAEAASHYAEAVRIDPNQAEAQLNLGIIQSQAGNTAEALAHLEQAVRLKPGFADAHSNFGIALAQAGRLPEAVRQYEEALRLRPEYASAHYNLGNALIELHRWPEAKTHFAEAVQIDPHFDAAREMLERMQSLPSIDGPR